MHRPDETEMFDSPTADVKFIVEELLMAFMAAEEDNEKEIHLVTAVGSRFYKRVKTAAEFLGLTTSN